jgi:streptogramin lyase
MDEISQEPKLDFRVPRGRWLDAAVAVVLIAAATIAVMTGRVSRPADAPAAVPGAAAASALLPSTVRARIPLPFGGPGDLTLLGSTAWISDWSTGQIVGVDLATRRITRMLHIGGQQDEPVSMTAGAGSLWVLDLAGPLLRIDPASGAITRRFPIRRQAGDVAYGDGFIWVITDPLSPGGTHEHLYKIDPSRNMIASDAPIPGTGQGCLASPGRQGVWVSCAGVDHITLINQASLKPEENVRVDSGGYTPQIAPGQKVVWVLTPAGLARVNPATATITAIIRTGYDPSPMSVPALTIDPASRVWAVGSLLAVVVPGTLTAYQVAHTADSISVAADGPTIWVDTGGTLAGLQVDTPLCDRCCCQ